MLLKATPVTTPGRAIGNTTRRFTVPLPKNSYRLNANATNDPRTIAMHIAPNATMAEFIRAARIGSDSNAINHHFRENSLIGQDEIWRSLNAFRIRTDSGAYIKISTKVTMAINDHLEVLENLSILVYILSSEPVRLATIRYITTNAMGTIENAAATGGFKLIFEAMIEPII